MTAFPFHLRVVHQRVLVLVREMVEGVRGQVDLVKASLPYCKGHGLRGGIDFAYHRFAHVAMEILMITLSYQKLVFGSLGLCANQVTETFTVTILGPHSLVFGPRKDPVKRCDKMHPIYQGRHGRVKKWVDVSRHYASSLQVHLGCARKQFLGVTEASSEGNLLIFFHHSLDVLGAVSYHGKDPTTGVQR